MNDKETEYYTVIRDGEEIKIPASEFYSTGGLTVPSTPFVPTQEERWQEENSNTQYAQYSSQPSIRPVNPKQDYYEDTYEAPVAPHEHLPASNYIEQPEGFANKWKGDYE